MIRSPLSLLHVVSFALVVGACASAPKPEDPAVATAGGIGAMVRLDAQSGGLAIDKLATKGAGTAAGLQLYDQIWSIDGQPIDGVAFDDLVARLRGRVGSKVTLLAGRIRADAREVVVVRAELPPDVRDCQAGDCQNGNGTSVDRFGERYDGQFKDGKYDGQGKLVEPSGRTYEGAFVADMASGHGIFTSAGGLRFEGDFGNGYPTGSIKVTLPNGDVYQGETKDYYMNGQGKLTRPSSGDVWDGRYELDCLVDGLWQHYPAGGDGRSCVRYVREGQLATTGTITYAPKDKKKKVSFQGVFGDDCVANGEGLMTYEKKKMQGTFANDEPQKGAKVVK